MRVCGVTSLCPGSDCGCNDLVQREQIHRMVRLVADRYGQPVAAQDEDALVGGARPAGSPALALNTRLSSSPGLTRDGLTLLLIGARVDHDMRPFAGQPQHSRTADIAPRSGDQRDLPFELAHAPITLRYLHRTPPLGSARAAQCFRTARWPLLSKRTGCQGWHGGPAQCGKIRLLLATARARRTPCETRRECPYSFVSP